MKGILYTGGELTDLVTFARLPTYLQAFLREQNGVVAYFGGLHIRGCVAAPNWHSLASVWQGERALWRTYTEVQKADIPFAQDCAGNQFLLRGDAVLWLDTETGELADLEVDFKHFLFGAEKFPLDALGMEPLRAFQLAGGTLQPGQLLSLYPPLCIATKGKSKPSAKAVSVTERLAWLAEFHRQIKDLPDGQQVRLTPL
ncbi:SMI1/KNR4 family protein [Hymenobacter endophyticus]|uniref:SMI1/KNR4 family protein n=1 Tax=Hymenobacter endophyticus TaxID=3076335 RepID=A0ABU3TJK4_9BACT|nr:SMI1/KNR4 family protein [Hymenobacter endophyticus]MDU0371554.1 SMI1/KNR4 family protein [Hymenobacter endophyticus]